MSVKIAPLAFFPLLGTGFDQRSLIFTKMKGSDDLEGHGEIRKDWKTNPCCLNPKIITYWSHLFFPEVPDGTDTVRPLLWRAPVFLKSCSENICVLFKSRIKFLMPIFKFPGINIKGSHAFPPYCHLFIQFFPLYKMCSPKKLNN